MSAQPVADYDPVEILSVLPVRYHELILAQYDVVTASAQRRATCTGSCSTVGARTRIWASMPGSNQRVPARATGGRSSRSA
jgi:hypothetical protein